MHSNDGSSHLPHGGHGGGVEELVLLLLLLLLGHETKFGQAGQTGGTISDLSIYKSSSPGGILCLGIFDGFLCRLLYKTVSPAGAVYED